MDQQLKQRLVGVGVIFALAVIFLPLLLDGSGRRPEDLNVIIPPPPNISSNVRVEEKIIELKKEIQQIPVLEPLIIDEVNSPPGTPDKIYSKNESQKITKPDETQLVTADKPKISAKPAAKPVNKDKPIVKPQTGGESWVIQVGSFSERDKAYQLRDKLRKSRLSSVFIEQYRHQGTTRYRVRMGPFILQKKARIVQNKVKAKFNVNGLVMRYEK